MLIIGGVIIILFIFVSLFAPLLTSHDPYKRDISNRFSSPSSKHYFGTDQFGRDIFTRVLYGARISFKVGLISVAIGVFGGVFLGALSGYLGGIVDDVLMRLMDALLAFPPLLLAVGLVAAAGPGLLNVATVIGVLYIPRFARVMRSAVLAEKEREYVEAARAIGQSGFKILFRHIGPATLSSSLVLATVVFALSIIIEAALSFLGVGMPPPTPSWGTMLDEARRYMFNSTWLPVWPGLSISLVVLGFNLLGDGLRDLLDPKARVMFKV